MRVFSRAAELTSFLRSAEKQNFIGFVPTMGALHKGHLSLLQRSLKENTITVISIYVNPTQFNDPEDLKNYPRTLSNDIEQIKSVDPSIVVFAPETAEIYVEQTVASRFDFDGLDAEMEGKYRAGHFDGVATVVKRLFDIVQPHRAYFGEKDFQQLQIVRKLVEKHAMQVDIIGCPIFRENNGLAMSSRNERLSASERAEAAFIYKTLTEAKARFATNSPAKIIGWVNRAFLKKKQFKLDYFAIADEKNLLPVKRKSKGKQYRAFIAVFLGNVRLIDTISLN